MADERIFLTLPYARPKVGRRASDQRLLDDWHSQVGRHVGPAVEPSRADDAPGRLLWREPAESFPAGRARAPERRSLFP